MLAVRVCIFSAYVFACERVWSVSERVCVLLCVYLCVCVSCMSKGCCACASGVCACAGALGCAWGRGCFVAQELSMHYIQTKRCNV